jgi:hypothetical protein
VKKTTRVWLANSRVDVRLCKHSYFPLLLAIPLFRFCHLVILWKQRKTFSYVYIELRKHSCKFGRIRNVWKHSPEELIVIP